MRETSFRVPETLEDHAPGGVDWRLLTEAEARARQDFGLRGWLGAATALNLLMLTMLGFLLLRIWTTESFPPEWAGEAAPFEALRWYFTLCALALLVFQIGAWTKWSRTPEAAAAALVFIAAITLVLDMLWPPRGALWIEILLSHALSWAVLALIARWLLRGRGPNLTFKRRIRAEEAGE